MLLRCVVPPHLTSTPALALLSVLAAAPGAEAQPASAAAPDAGVVPTAALVLRSSELEAALQRELGGSVGERVNAPAVVAARLAAAPGVQQLLATATQHLAQAEQLAVKMEREECLAAARLALDLLDQACALFHAPHLVARAQIVIAMASMLEPADAPAARMAFRAALDADPARTPDERLLSPRLLQLLEEARRLPSSNARPAPTLLARLARLSGLTPLLWVDVGSEGQQTAVQIWVYDAQRQAVVRRLSNLVASRELMAGTARMILLVLNAEGSPAAGANAQTERAGTSEGPTATGATRPWYRRWWIWAAAGAIAVTAVGLGVGLATADHDQPAAQGFDFSFRFPLTPLPSSPTNSH